MEDEVAAWLRAQAEADRGKARAASRAKADGDAWQAGDGGDGWTQAGTPVHRPDGGLLAFAIGDYAARHIAAHDPLTEIARAESVLAVLDEYEAAAALAEAEVVGPRGALARAGLSTLGRTLRLLAYGYRHREGWCEAWRP